MAKINFPGLVVFSFSILVSIPAVAEENSSIFSFKGFGTFAVTGTDTDAIGFRRDTTTEHGATKSWNIPTDSRLGFQLDAHFNNSLSATGQWVLRDRTGQFFEQNLDLAFLRWNVTPELTVRFGRVSTDIFMLSDHRNVGYSYPWLRPPVDFYGHIPIYHWDGVDISQQFDLWGGILKFKVFGGHTFNQIPTAVSAKADISGPIFSSSLTFEKGDWQGRLSFSQLDNASESTNLKPLRLSLHDPALNVVWPGIKSIAPYFKSIGTTVRFSEIGVAYDDGVWLGQAEASYIDSDNQFVPSMGSGYLSLGRRLTSFTLYTLLGISKSISNKVDVPKPMLPDPRLLAFRQGLVNSLNKNGIDQKSISLGLRWDFYTNMAFKAQWSHFWLGENGTQIWVEDPRQTPPEEANVFSVGIDFLF